MSNLLRMDIRRMSRSKMFYIAFGSLSAAIVISIILFHVLTDPNLRSVMINAGMTVSTGGAGVDESVFDQLLDMTEAEAIISTVYNGGLFYVALYLVVALFVCSDYESGFAKNIFSLQGTRWKYYFSKLMCAAAVCASWILGSFVIFKGVSLICGMSFRPMSLRELALFFGGYLFLGIAFSAQAIFISVTTRSAGAGVGAAIVMSGGLAVVIIDAVIGNFGLSIMSKTLYGSIQGITGYFAQGDPLATPLLTAAVWIVIWSVLSCLVLRKRDI